MVNQITELKRDVNNQTAYNIFSFALGLTIGIVFHFFAR